VAELKWTSAGLARIGAVANAYAEYPNAGSVLI
jgi:hypothetical protein